MPGSVKCIFNTDAVWQPAFFTGQIPQPNTIYTWHGITAELPQLYPSCYALLTADEQTKANTYFQADHRQRYIIQHGLLRKLLGWYLKTVVFNGAFIYNNAGKLYLSNNNTQSCFFNLSSSGGEFIIAIGDKELGVDIECRKAGIDYQSILLQYFEANEREYINHASNPLEAFFLLWTRKEALLKATGKGIDDNLQMVPALNGKHILPDSYDDVDWLTASFKLKNNGVMSIAYPSGSLSLQFMYLDAQMVL